MRLAHSIAWIASGVSVFLATLPAVVSWPGFGIAAVFRLYDPTVAVLTATLVAVIWYSYFTFMSVRRVEEARAFEQRTNIRRFVSTAMAIRAQVLGLKEQLDYWHNQNAVRPLHGFEVRYLESEIIKLEDQTFGLNHLAAQISASSQADVDVALVHLRSVRAGLQPLKEVLASGVDLNAAAVTKQVNDTKRGFDLVLGYFQSAIDRVAGEDRPLSREVAEYFRDFKSALERSPDARGHSNSNKEDV